MSSLTLLGKLIVGIVALALACLGGIYYATRPQQEPTPVACTADAMRCPDGSYVGRTGPNCVFICPAGTSTVATTTVSATSTATTTSGGGGFAEYHSGIRGTVTAGPTCPVMQNPPDPQCADKPLQTLVAVFRTVDAVHAIALLQSKADGTFEVSLPPGDYVVGAGESNLPRCPQTPATVGPTGYTDISISCDTGIR